ncbi:MAG TPA: hypothetical protein VGR07_02475 [Thermoanaerobaculia bacterium]|jgi:hypothetical protein|nr:hypothetical protein [Thermoanaerobaculia bacterium]
MRSSRLGKSCAAAVLAACCVTSPAGACSICRCGDPTFNALGTDVYTAGTWNFRVALDWERFEKEQGTFDPGALGALDANTAADHRAGHDVAPAARESQVENRFTTTLAYTVKERLNLVARLPWSSRQLTAADGIQSSHDLSDPELYGLVRLWSSDFAPGLGKRAWVSALGGVKTNWGRNDLTLGGVRRDEHLQAGTGSTDVFGGLSSFYLLDSRSSVFGSAQYRKTGGNDFGYRYGNITIGNVGYEHRIGDKLDTLVELNYRYAGRDRLDASGILDPNTGGAVLYATPHLSWDLGKGVVGRLSVQIPVVRNLNGDQREKTVANVGLTYLF